MCRYDKNTILLTRFSSGRGSRLMITIAVRRLGIPPSVRPARAAVFQETGTITNPQPTTRTAVVLGTVDIQARTADNAAQQLVPARRAFEPAHQSVPLRGRAQPQPLQLGLHVTAPCQVDGCWPEPAEEPRGRRGAALRVFPPKPRRLVGPDLSLRLIPSGHSSSSLRFPEQTLTLSAGNNP